VRRRGDFETLRLGEALTEFATKFSTKLLPNERRSILERKRSVLFQIGFQQGDERQEMGLIGPMSPLGLTGAERGERWLSNPLQLM
jgi:hypothetical protein